MTDDYKHHYTAIQEHLETLKTLKGPVYAVESKNHYLEIIKHAERLKDLKGPIYECGEIGHKYGGSSNFTPEATDLKTLTGPIFKIDHANQFSEIISCAHELKELHGPIYQADGDTKHQFREMTRLVESLVPMAKPVMVEEGKHSYGEQTMAGYGAEGVKTVHGPIYVKEFSKHNYQEKPKEDHLNTVQLQGPIYMTDDYKHHYAAIQEHLETLKTLKGPVYDVESKNHYLAIIKHAEIIKDLKGPIYEFGEAGHKFAGSSNFTPEAADLKSLHGPKFEIDNGHHFSEIISNAHELKELHAPIYNKDGETSHKFNLMTKAVESLVPMAKPVFMEEGRHTYGEQTMAGYGAGGVKTVHGPIYVKEFSKHNYQEKPKEDHLNTIQLKGKHTLFLIYNFFFQYIGGSSSVQVNYGTFVGHKAAFIFLLIHTSTIMWIVLIIHYQLTSI